MLGIEIEEYADRLDDPRGLVPVRPQQPVGDQVREREADRDERQDERQQE
jgi:hypothetical protein